MGSEYIKQCVEEFGCKRVLLIGPTFKDVRDVMFYGESGIDSIYPEWHPNKPRFVPSTSKIIWPNGAEAQAISAEEPENLRGWNSQCIWIDELGRCSKAQDVYDGAHFTLRLKMPNGMPPRLLITTTPRPIPVIRNLIKESEVLDSGVIIITGTTKENEENLDPRAVKKMYKRYEGTRLGRQELYAELLSDHENALWTNESIENSKRNLDLTKDSSVIDFCKSGELKRIVIGVDPSGGGGGKADTQGIVVVGIDQEDIYHVLADESCTKSPSEWAKHIENVYYKYTADKIIVEKNFGGALVESVLTASWKSAPIKMIHASRAKVARAEPISMLYERGQVLHYKYFEELEKQMFDMTSDGFKGSGSPDRVDALVWAIHELMSRGNSNLNKTNVTGRMY